MNKVISFTFFTVLISAACQPIPAAAQTDAEKVQLPEIQVTATPLGESLLEYGKPVSVFTKEEIESNLRSTLGETIGLAPGVHTSFSGQGASRPVIRGFSGDRVRILRDGTGSGDVSNISEDHVVVADPLQAEQIEILRGPEALLFGGTAIGGAVNVTSNAIHETAVGAPFTADVLSQLGNSADNEKSFAARLNGESGAFNWHASLFSRETDSYEIPGTAESSRLLASEQTEPDDADPLEQHEAVDEDEEAVQGIVPDSATETSGATVGGSYIWDSGYAGLSVSGFDSEYGVPGHAHENTEDEHEADDHEGDAHESESEGGVLINARQKRIDMRAQFDSPSPVIEAIKVRSSFSDYEHDEIEDGSVATTFQKDTFESRLEFLHATADEMSGVSGLQFLHEDFSALGEEAYLTPTETISPAVFLFEEFPIAPSLSLRAGGRLEYVHHDPHRFATQDFLPFSISTGPLWQVTPDGAYTAGLTVSYTQRAPTPSELFSDGQHLARQIFEIGSSRLGVESALGADLVFSKNTGFITGSFTPFFQHFSNYLNLDATDEVINDLPVHRYEETEAYFWGFEFLSTLAFDELLNMGAHSFALDTQFDFVRARDTIENENLPRIPPFRSVLRARYAFETKFDAALESVFVTAQDDVAAFELPTGNYTLLNAETSVSLPFFEANNLRLFARGSNLTDDEARVHSSFLKDLAPLRGRSFLFGIKGVI